VSWAHEGGAWVPPPRGEAQAIEVVNDELKAPKVNCLIEGEAIAHQMITIGTDGERRWGNHRNVKSKSMLQIPLPGTPTVDVFAPARYRVVKITRSSSEVVLWTIKHTMIYPDLGPTLEVIALHLAVQYRRWIGVTRG
jgi:hypothetical protein